MVTGVKNVVAEDVTVTVVVCMLPLLLPSVPTATQGLVVSRKGSLHDRCCHRDNWVQHKSADEFA